MLSEDMTEFQKELEESFKKAGVHGFNVENSAEIMSKIKNKYVEGNPRAWWLSLKNKVETIPYEDNSAYKNIPALIKGRYPETISSIVYFIADEDNESLYLYRIPLEKLTLIIEECRYFEYYIVSSELSWMVCENDHGELILCSAP